MPDCAWFHHRLKLCCDGVFSNLGFDFDFCPNIMAQDSSSADWAIIGQMFNTLLNFGVAVIGEHYIKPGMLDLCHGAPLFVEATREETMILGLQSDIPAWWGLFPPIPRMVCRAVLLNRMCAEQMRGPPAWSPCVVPPRAYSPWRACSPCTFSCTRAH